MKKNPGTTSLLGLTAIALLLSPLSFVESRILDPGRSSVPKVIEEECEEDTSSTTCNVTATVEERQPRQSLEDVRAQRQEAIDARQEQREQLVLERQENRAVREADLEERKQEVQRLQEENRLRKCEILNLQLNNIAEVRNNQVQRIAERYARIVERIEEIITWQESQGIDVSEIRSSLNAASVQQKVLLDLAVSYTNQLEETTVGCQGDEVSQEVRENLDSLRSSARELYQKNIELRQLFRDELLAKLRANQN